MAEQGSANSISEAAFGCRGDAFCCTGAVYGSHATDMQYMLRLAAQPGPARRSIYCISPGYVTTVPRRALRGTEVRVARVP